MGDQSQPPEDRPEKTSNDSDHPTIMHAGEGQLHAGEGDSINQPTLAEAEQRQGTPKLPTIEGYEILEILGWGGMGIVYKARQVGLNRLVALKRILAGAHAKPDEIARFRTEASAIARLKHPNIVQVYEIGEADGHPYFSLEFVEGGTLAEKLQGVPQDPVDSAELVATLSYAVHYAHMQGVAHRDLKPGNILLSDELAEVDDASSKRSSSKRSTSSASGKLHDPNRLSNNTPKVSDFGLAKQLDEDSSQTQTGNIIGSPSYMAPEQATGRPADVGPEVDIYALGAILYELLTGRPPFRAAATLDTLEQVRTQDPVPPTQLQPKVPRDIETICLKCLQKQPARRYPSAQHLAEDLHRFAAGEPILARPVSSAERVVRWCQRNPFLSAALGLTLAAIVSIGALSFFFAVRESWHAGNLENALKESEDHRLSAERRLAESFFERGLNLCIRDDVSTGLLWMSKGLESLPPGNEDLERVIRQNLSAWRRQLGELTAIVPGTDPNYPLQLSHDGRKLLAIGSDGRVRLSDTKTGRMLASPFPEQGKVTAWLSSNSEYVVTRNDSDGNTRIWKTDNVTSPIALPHEAKVDHVCLDPRNKWLITTSKTTFFPWNVDSGKPHSTSITQKGHIAAAEFSPAGEILVTRQAKSVYFWDTNEWKPRGKPFRCRSRILRHQFSPDGKRLAVSDQSKTTHIIDTRTGLPVCTPLVHEHEVKVLLFSPDSQKLMTAGGTRLYRYDEVQLWDAVSGKALNEKLDIEQVRAFVFTPDSKTLITGGGDRFAHYWSTSTGERFARRNPHRNDITALDLSSDGKTLLSGDRDGTARLWEFETGAPLTPILQHLSSIFFARLVGDGLYFVTQTEHQIQKWKRPQGLQRNSLQVKHPHTATQIGFSHDHQAVLFAAELDAADAVVTRDLIPSETKIVAEQPGFIVRRVAISETGRFVVVSGVPYRGIRNEPKPGFSRIWDNRARQWLHPPQKHSTPITTVSISPDDQYYLTGHQKGLVQVWDLNTREPVSTAKQLHATRVASSCFSPSGTQVVTGGADRFVKVWDFKNDQIVSDTSKHLDWVIAASFGAEARQIISGSDDTTARIWDAVTGDAVSRPLVHTDAVSAVALSGDGRLALTGSEGRKAIVWDVQTAHQLTPAMLHPDDVLAVAFDRNKQTIWTACPLPSGGIGIYSWLIPPPMSGTIEEVKLQIQVATGRELDSNDAMQVLDAGTWFEYQAKLAE